jgi:hypothetical protein
MAGTWEATRPAPEKWRRGRRRKRRRRYLPPPPPPPPPLASSQQTSFKKQARTAQQKQLLLLLLLVVNVRRRSQLPNALISTRAAAVAVPVAVLAAFGVGACTYHPSCRHSQHRRQWGVPTAIVR